MKTNFTYSNSFDDPLGMMMDQSKWAFTNSIVWNDKPEGERFSVYLRTLCSSIDIPERCIERQGDGFILGGIDSLLGHGSDLRPPEKDREKDHSEEGDMEKKR